MDVLHLQALLGHASLDMVQHYAQMANDDLLQAHQAHYPIDNLTRLR
jgi:site-specific recombinase XerD